MSFFFSLTDFSLWLAITALVLLVTSESLFSQSALTLRIDKKRFRLISVLLGMAFVVTVFLKAVMPELF